MTAEIKEHLIGLGHTVDDLGMRPDGEFIPYYESAARIARAVSQGRHPRGIIVCGTGAGSVIVANKFKGVYAVQASSEYEACLDARFTEGFQPEWQAVLNEACAKIQQIESENPT